MYHTNNNKWQVKWSLTYQQRWCCSHFGEEDSSNGEMATVLMGCWQQPQFFVNTAWVMCASLRAVFARLYVIRGGHSNAVQPARARNIIRTIVHNTYERMLIQNSRTSCRPTPTQQTTQHNFSTPTTMTNPTHMTMNLDNIWGKYAKKQAGGSRE